MGLMHHHAIVATTWSDVAMADAKGWVAAQSPDHADLFAFLPSLVKGYRSVVLGPDGSKEGWDTSDVGDDLRARFIEFLKRNRAYADGSSPWDWVEVEFGELGARVSSTNCKD